ncbi:MAG TPA: chaperone modulator CbpM [Solirubrobacteraceae bacterium]|nr:chaperone modulator CbpM [Solirubrobacteraceae bacterium]
MATPSRAPVRAQLVRRQRTLIGVEVLARETGLHPDLVLRLVRLGLVEPAGANGTAPLFDGTAVSRLARALRLRRDLGLNYAGAVLAGELLARIDDLEARLRRYEPPPPARGERRDPPSQRRHAEVITWTRTV